MSEDSKVVNPVIYYVDHTRMSILMCKNCYYKIIKCKGFSIPADQIPVKCPKCKVTLYNRRKK